MPIVAPLANQGCFGCGPSNPIGLHLHFEHHANGGVQARFTPGLEHQGWDGVMHGGLVTVLLDEAMAWAAAEKTRMYYTGRLEVRYRRPVTTGADVLVRGWITRDRGRSLETRAEIHSAEGETLAEGTALFLAAR
ncbi:MAG: PaaI family thioesterase [Chloroflexi bacterium]|nr:PaaI family thioesterase [Chloroflexota bacterium]